MATFRLGESTTTDDAEGETLALHDASGVTADALAKAIVGLTGEIAQRPSAVSAIKVDGRRAYDRVRSGEDVVLAARTVRISEFTVLDFRPADAEVTVRVTCSSGTYIRALARDVGETLGVGAHVRSLRRTAIGSVTVADCVTLDEFAADPRVAAIADAGAAWFASVVVSHEAAGALSHGRRTCPAPPGFEAASTLVVNPAGNAICYAGLEHGMHPTAVFVAPDAPSRGHHPVKRWFGLDQAEQIGPITAIGVYDGVHRGHRLLIRRGLSDARRSGHPMVVVTFSPNPAEVVRERPPTRLATLEHRLLLIESLGVDATPSDFDQHMSQLSPAQFVNDVLVDGLGAACVVVGENFRFGYRASGDVEALRQFGAPSGMTVDAVSLLREALWVARMCRSVPPKSVG